MNREIAVVYGAGATRDSGYKMRVKPGSNDPPQLIDPPLNSKFFKEDIIKNTLAFESIRFFVEKYFAVPDGTNNRNCDLDLEEVWSAVDLNHKHIGLGTYDWKSVSDDYLHNRVRRENLDWEDMRDDPTAPGRKNPSERKFLGDCGRDLKRLCHHIYGDSQLPDSLQNGADNYSSLHFLLTGMEYKVEYITFNYDTCLEKSLDARDVPVQYVTDYGIPNVGFVQKSVHVAKLHGSLNWELNKSLVRPLEIKVPPIPYVKDNFLAVEPRYPNRFQPDIAVTEPLIIPPTWFKNEINDDSRAENRVTQLILHQWRVALEILRRADLIIVVGYSFPVTDFHVQRLFRLALMGRANADSLRLLYCTKADDGREAKQRLSFLKISDDKLLVEINGFSTLCQQNCLQEHLKTLGMPVTPKEKGAVLA